MKKIVIKNRLIVVKMGMGGTLGNKGSCRIGLGIEDSNMIFYCCHLESG